MTALGKLMAPFPYRTKKKRGRYNIPHTLMHFGCGGYGGKVGFSFFCVIFSRHNLTSVLSAAEICPTPCSKKRGIKGDDISQHSLQRNKINVQSRVFIKGSPVLRS